ncbi:MAG: GyrI-like domain-containing protein [Deltaproteobacteria bacterium]|nr:GyrI-like domain-containing protein [Deltaproteobacteria bacterium]
MARPSRVSARKRSAAKPRTAAAPTRAATAKTRKAAVRAKPGTAADLRRLRPAAYEATVTPRIVVLDPTPCLAVEGRGAPEGPDFQEAAGILYATAWSLKLALKAAGREFKVPPLEGLWWSDADLRRLDDPRALWRLPRSAWRWKLLLPLPDGAAPEDVRRVREELCAKRGDLLPNRVRLERIEEGRCVQALHVGPYAKESETVRRMVAYARERGLQPCGFHHEIYLSDPRATPPEKLRTILRLAVR